MNLRIENVSRLKGKNLKVVTDWLENQGYNCAIFLRADPVALGWPVRRSRVYICASLAHNFYHPHTIYEQLQGYPQSLQSVDDIAVASELLPLRQRHCTKSDNCALDRQSMIALAARPLSSSRKSAFDCQIHEEHSGVLNLRELRVLSLVLEDNPGIRFVDLSQSSGRAPAGTDVIPCITPGGRIYDITHKRFLSGRQKLLAQGIFPSQPANPKQNDLEGDLAGNAFNSIVFAAVLIAALASSMPWKFNRYHGKQGKLDTKPVFDWGSVFHNSKRGFGSRDGPVQWKAWAMLKMSSSWFSFSCRKGTITLFQSLSHVHGFSAILWGAKSVSSYILSLAEALTNEHVVLERSSQQIHGSTLFAPSISSHNSIHLIGGTDPFVQMLHWLKDVICIFLDLRSRRMSQQMVPFSHPEQENVGSVKICAICRCTSEDQDPLNQAWTETIFICLISNAAVCSAGSEDPVGLVHQSHGDTCKGAKKL